MKKLVFILLLCATSVWGRGGPKYGYPDNHHLDDEINHIYEDMSQNLYNGMGSQSILNGGVAVGNYTSANIKATVPLYKGLILYCTDCATVPLCVSTGTLINQWSLITNRTSACQ